MNEVMNNILTRRSVRRYKPEPVERGLIDNVIEAGLYAASGMNRQSTIFIPVTDRALRDRLSDMNAAVMGREGIDPFYGAPAVIIVLADKTAPTYVYDGALAMGNMMLAAHSLGLASCWVHRAKEEFESAEGREILDSLGIHGDYEGIGHLILGYAGGEYPAPAPRAEGRVFG